VQTAVVAVPEKYEQAIRIIEFIAALVGKLKIKITMGLIPDIQDPTHFRPTNVDLMVQSVQTLRDLGLICPLTLHQTLYYICLLKTDTFRITVKKLLTNIRDIRSWKKAHFNIGTKLFLSTGVIDATSKYGKGTLIFVLYWPIHFSSRLSVARMTTDFTSSQEFFNYTWQTHTQVYAVVIVNRQLSNHKK